MASRSDASPSRLIVLWAFAIVMLLAVMEGACAIFLHFIIGSRAHFLIRILAPAARPRECGPS